MPEFRRGREAIEEAANRKGGSGNYRPFVPEFQWREDGEKKYVLILTPIDDVATLDLHEFIPVGTGQKANGETYTKYEKFLSRKDPFVGENYDDLEDRLNNKPKTRCMGVAVELEPVLENVRGRQRPKGFVVKTETFERKVDGGGTETITAPVIGLITQSAYLMWSPLTSLDESQGPLYELPIEITRRGKDANTRYDFVPYMDAPVDLSPVVDHVDGLSYIAEEADTEYIDSLSSLNERERAQSVAETIFDRRVAELADKERYDELVAPIQELVQRFGQGNKSPVKPPVRPTRPARSSPRDQEGHTSDEEEHFARLRARLEKRD